MRPVEDAVHDEIQKLFEYGCLSADGVQVAVNEGGGTPQIQPPRRMAGFKASGTKANLLENQ